MNEVRSLDVLEELIEKQAGGWDILKRYTIEPLVSKSKRLFSRGATRTGYNLEGIVPRIEGKIPFAGYNNPSLAYAWGNPEILDKTLKTRGLTKKLHNEIFNLRNQLSAAKKEMAGIKRTTGRQVSELKRDLESSKAILSTRERELARAREEAARLQGLVNFGEKGKTIEEVNRRLEQIMRQQSYTNATRNAANVEKTIREINNSINAAVQASNKGGMKPYHYLLGGIALGGLGTGTAIAATSSRRRNY